MYEIRETSGALGCERQERQIEEIYRCHRSDLDRLYMIYGNAHKRWQMYERHFKQTDKRVVGKGLRNDDTTKEKPSA